jgi:hypothetical protein
MDAFITIFNGPDSNLRPYEIRDAQQSPECSNKAIKLCAARDLHFVGGMINRALTESFNRVAQAILTEHKMRLDEGGNNLLMLGTRQGLTLLVKEMVYLGGINIEQRNHKGETAMVIACKEVRSMCCSASGIRLSIGRDGNSALRAVPAIRVWRTVMQRCLKSDCAWPAGCLGVFPGSVRGWSRASQQPQRGADDRSFPAPVDAREGDSAEAGG